MQLHPISDGNGKCGVCEWVMRWEHHCNFVILPINKIGHCICTYVDCIGKNMNLVLMWLKDCVLDKVAFWMSEAMCCQFFQIS